MSKHNDPPSGIETLVDRSFQIEFEGRLIGARPGDTVASALIAAGLQVLSRSPKFHRPRTVFCLSGSCGACLLRIDGRPNMRACQVEAEPGQKVSRQNAWPSADYDFFSAADVFFADGMDHHTLLTSPPSLNRMMQRVVKQLGGLGRLPDEETIADAVKSAVCRHVDVLVVGGGPAGLSAATEASRTLGKNRDVVLLDAQHDVGGSYLCHPELGRSQALWAVEQADEAGVEILRATAALGYFPEERHLAQPPDTQGFLAAASEKMLYKLSAKRYIYATGAYAQNLTFVDNDRPGVLSGRAVGRLLACHGIRIGERPLVVGNGEFAEALVRALRRNGQTVLQIDGEREKLARALGKNWVDGAEVLDERGVRKTMRCDLIVVATTPAAASELPVQHGVRVELQGKAGFVVIAQPDGQTEVPGVYGCGELTSPMSVERAAGHGAVVGRAAAAQIKEDKPTPAEPGL